MKTIRHPIAAAPVLALALVILACNNSPTTPETRKGDPVKVETPLGTLSANDSQQAVKDIGVDIYPGARVQKSGAADLTIGSMRTVIANFETSDSADQVCNFYKSTILGATIKTSDPNHCSIVSKEPQHIIEIKVDGGDPTKLQIASITKAPGS